jgi:hypothetical protein
MFFHQQRALIPLEQEDNQKCHEKVAHDLSISEFYLKEK